MSSTLQVESADVIKLILQFMQEHNLQHSMRALQEETQVSLNAVDNVERFVQDIQHGRWDVALPIVSRLTLPIQKLCDLYEQIVLELIESREYDAARSLLRASHAFQRFKIQQPERYLLLEHMLNRTQAGAAFDTNVAYPQGTNKEKRRQHIAQALSSEVQVIPPSRLLSLLTQSLKYQQLQGLLPPKVKYDLFRGAAAADPREAAASGATDAFPTRNSKVIKFGSNSYPEVVKFSPDGLWIVSGSVDGYIEIWDVESGRLSQEFSYQADDNLMSHDSAVLAITFNTSMELLASGSAKGEIKVWRIATGSCVRKFPVAHSEGVTSLEFLRDGTQLLSASFDSTIKAHGLKSGRTLKEFRGHSSFVNAAIFNEDQSQVLSASADGTVRVWDYKTCDCLKTIKMNQAGLPVSLLGLHLVPTHTDRVLVVERSGILRVLSISDGSVINVFNSTSTSLSTSSSSSASNVTGALSGEDGKSGSSSSTAASSSTSMSSARAKKLSVAGSGSGAIAAGDFVAACFAARGSILYGVTEECVLHCFEMETGNLLHAIKTHRGEILGLSHHPHRNLLASYAQDGTIKLWKP